MKSLRRKLSERTPLAAKRSRRVLIKNFALASHRRLHSQPFAWLLQAPIGANFRERFRTDEHWYERYMLKMTHSVAASFILNVLANGENGMLHNKLIRTNAANVPGTSLTFRLR